jgi:PAS domain S-box-containing protein
VAPILFRRRPYFVALVSVLAAGAIRTALDPWLGQSVPYLTYFPAVALAAWYGGLGGGGLATSLSAAAALRYVNPAASFPIMTTADAISLALFCTNGLLLSLIGERAQRAVLDQRQFAAIAESSDDAIIAKGLDSVITAWNGGAERLFGYTSAEAVGRPITLIIPEDRWHEEERVIAHITAGHRIQPFDTVRRHKNGTLVDVSVTVSPVRGGVPIGCARI